MCVWVCLITNRGNSCAEHGPTGYVRRGFSKEMVIVDTGRTALYNAS